MANKKGILIPSQGGFWRDGMLRIKLILRLLGDKRVSPWLKILPVGGLIYLISPIDIIPDILVPIVGELDDIAILWLTNYLFIELCPKEVVQEHVKKLSSNMDIVEGRGEVVDADSVVINDPKK